MSPSDLIEQLDYRFSLFDQIIDKYGLEKIKTIGDAYMCAGGVTLPQPDHAVMVTRAALEMRDAIRDVAIDQSVLIRLTPTTHYRQWLLNMLSTIGSVPWVTTGQARIKAGQRARYEMNVSGCIPARCWRE